MILWIRIFLLALKAIMTNKVRSFLTMLGVIIGVGSVVMLTSIGTGLQAYVTQEFSDLGTNTLLIFPADIFSETGSLSTEQSVSSVANSKLSLREVNNIRSLREHVKVAAPFAFIGDKMSFQSDDVNTIILGTTFEYPEAFNTPTEIGRFFTKTEENSGDRVVVLGNAIADELFGEVDPIGKRVRIGGQTFKVVGVAVEKGSGFGGPSLDTYAYIPLKTYYRLYDTETIARIVVKSTDPSNVEPAIKALETELAKTLDDDEFSVVDQAEILETITQILGVLTAGLGGIAAISLVVGGIGIMNIMLVSVTERTKEIGLRKALGATPTIILAQFLMEAALLSIFGGLIGLGLAWLGTLAIQQFVAAQITTLAVVLAFGVSTVTGLVFGAAPAYRAAKLSPIEALRYE